MAEAENEEDLDLDAKPSSNKKMIIIIVIVGVLLIGASVGLTIWLVSGDSDGGGDEEVVAEEMVKKAQYLPLETMVVNFAESKRARYLQVDIQLMAYDPQMLTVVEEHMPVIRNDILVLLGGQSYETVSSREGKEQLRQQILEKVNMILKQQAAVDGRIDAVYFTNFVMQ